MEDQTGTSKVPLPEEDEGNTLDLPELTEAANYEDKDQESDLESFRLRWKEELDTISKKQTKKSNNSSDSRSSPSESSGRTQRTKFNPSFGRLATVPENKDNKNEDSTLTHDINVQKKECVLSEEEKENLARTIFIKGIELERSGKLYEAVKQYKKAVHLVPDIERKTTENIEAGYDSSSSDDEDSEAEEDCHEALSNGGLYNKLTNLLDTTAAVCQPHYPVSCIRSHISSLPREILENILLWLVGSDLDMRSLDAMTAVCRGFYVLTKSEALWKKACQRVWGRECSLKVLDTDGQLAECSSWRELFLSRPQPRYNGCYISKTTYFRSGESNFHDTSYQPWHLVTYHRLFRFFPGGTVLMFTSSESPQNIITYLSQKDPKHAQVLVGTYVLDGALLYLKFTRFSDNKKVQHYGRRGKRREVQNSNDIEKTLMDITFELAATRRGVKNWFLSWRDYSITTQLFTGQLVPANVDINNQDTFPQLAFSRVKSYLKESVEPLT